MQKTAINGHKLKVKVCKLVIEPLQKCKSIKPSVKLSLDLLSPAGYPLFQWYPQSNEILLNLSMKCWNSTFNAQGSRLIIVIVQVRALEHWFIFNFLV
jgi:hypothetical protein